MARPRPDEGNGWLRGTNLVLMTSTGRLLSGTVKDRSALAEGLREVLAAYAKLPESERRAKVVEGVQKPQAPPPPGGVVLTIYDRPLGRAPEGSYRLPEGQDLGGLRTDAPHGQRSSLWLTEAECRSLLPEDPRPGQTIQVPSRLARRIWLYGLVPQTLWVVEEFWKPDSVRAGNLQATVEEVSPDQVRLRLHGSVLLTGPGILHEWPNHKFIKNVENRYDARLEGVLVHERQSRKITRWDMVALGSYSGRWFTNGKGWKEATTSAPLPLGFAFELDPTAYDLPPDRRRPKSFVHAYLFHDREQHYWDPDRWLAGWKKQHPK